MKAEEAAVIIAEAIAAIAPDVEEELADLDRDVDLWEELDLDSMDHLNVMTSLSERTGVEIQERDYGRLRSVNALATHVAAEAN